MTTARDVMTPGAECAGVSDTVTEAARKMRDLGVGALPICGDDIEEALSTMARAGVRRLPVIDGHGLVGMISQADIARNLPEELAGRLVEAISTAPPTD
jgi:CBS domain-containing protein